MAIEYGIYCMLFEKLIPRHIHTQSEVRAEVTYQSVDDVKRALEEAGMPIKQIEVLILRASLGERRVVAIVLPNDLQEMPFEEPPRKHGTVRSRRHDTHQDNLCNSEFYSDPFTSYLVFSLLWYSLT